jgi:hypothetical protein
MSAAAKTIATPARPGIPLRFSLNMLARLRARGRGWRRSMRSIASESLAKSAAKA